MIEESLTMRCSEIDPHGAFWAALINNMGQITEGDKDANDQSAIWQ
jgi:hypothetical protein